MFKYSIRYCVSFVTHPLYQGDLEQLRLKRSSLGHCAQVLYDITYYYPIIDFCRIIMKFINAITIFALRCMANSIPYHCKLRRVPSIVPIIQKEESAVVDVVEFTAIGVGAAAFASIASSNIFPAFEDNNHQILAWAIAVYLYIRLDKYFTQRIYVDYYVPTSRLERQIDDSESMLMKKLKVSEGMLVEKLDGIERKVDELAKTMSRYKYWTIAMVAFASIANPATKPVLDKILEGASKLIRL